MKSAPCSMPRPRARLSSRAKAIWREMLPQIPGGYHPLFRSILERFCFAVDFKERIEAALRTDLPSVRRKGLNSTLEMFQEQIQSMADDLGFTPRSRLEILRNLRRAKRL
jgi:phage terminase small subunit